MKITDKIAVLECFKKEHKGYNEKISREELVEKFKIPDRGIRLIINELRNDGEPIVSNSKGSGYWYYTDTPYDRSQSVLMLRELYARIKELQKIAKPIEKCLYPEGQLELF